MNTCKTCKFWAVWSKTNGVAECDKVDSVIKEKDKTFEIIVDVDDNSGLSVTLVTGENFGCIHHVNKN